MKRLIFYIDEILFRAWRLKIEQKKEMRHLCGRSHVTAAKCSETCRLIRALARNFSVRVISECPNNSPCQAEYLDGARLDEIELPFPKFHLWYFTGGLRVIYLNVISLLIALNSNATAIDAAF